MSMKQCSQCQRLLPRSEFHQRRHYVHSGLRAACKACTALATQERKKRLHRPSTEESRLKRRIRTRTSTAIKRGELQVQGCEVCGAKAQAHHPDYQVQDAHLKVVWLCHVHHAAEHAKRGWTKQLELLFV